MKLITMVIMVLVMGFGVKFAQPYIMKAAGVPEMPGMPGASGMAGVEAPKFSSEESDLMSAVFNSAMRLFTGQASRSQLASELSDKLYAGRDPNTMKELGIELVKPGDAATPPEAGGSGVGMPIPLPGASAPQKPGTTAGTSPTAPGAAQRVANAPAGTGSAKPGAPGAPTGAGAPGQPLNKSQEALLGRMWQQIKANSLTMILVPVALLIMYLVHRIKERRSHGPDFVPAGTAILAPAESDPVDLTNNMHSLSSEDFELLVALIYQRQGYRITMPAGLSGGRGGDFTLARKSEKILVQCKRVSLEHRVPVERVRELHEAMCAQGITRGMYVVSCGFTWDARNFAKANGITLINARTLDALITTTRDKSEGDLLVVANWGPKLMSKVKLTPPLCPACEAGMDLLSVSNGSVWVCSQRPECKGRRTARKTFKIAPAAESADKLADPVGA
jgi:HJR/Mrr/RecB family endonuclease